MSAESHLQREVHQVGESAAGVFFLVLSYELGDSASAVGSLFRLAGEGGTAESILSTNDALRQLWVSPAGHLWLGSAEGRVATTAPIGWPAASGDLDYDVANGGPAWGIAALPRDRVEGLLPNVTAMWGSGDDDVHVGTHGGHLYRWDGRSWTQTRQGDGSSGQTIRSLRGHSIDDVYAVGTQNLLLHFDGHQWRQLLVPGTPTDGESLGGIALLDDGEVVVCASGAQGRLLRGNATGFSEFGRYPMPLIDVAVLGDRLLFAVWDGVAELSGQEVRIVKDNFKTSGAFEGRGRVFFTEPAAPRPQFIQHDPASATPWTRLKF